MLDTKDGAKYSGKFAVDGKDIDGELTFAGQDTELLLYHPEFFNPERMDDHCIHGALRDLTRVSLFGCIGPSASGSSWSQHLGSYKSASLGAHFILHGRRHLSPTDQLIERLHFVLKDGSVVFQDYQTFARALRVTPELLRPIVRETEKVIKRRIPIGKHPQIAYFTGRFEIFKAKTVIGKISAHHLPSLGSGGPEGVGFKNRIGLEIAFPEPLTFDDAIKALFKVLPLFEIIAGRRQEVETLSLRLKGKDRFLSTLDVYWCHPPRRKSGGGRNPMSIDMPIDVAREPKAFAQVLTNWLERHEDWRAARGRFSKSFSQENSFDANRLIGSANMFDLLPSSAVPKKVTLAKDLRDAQDASRDLFKALPDSIEKESVLNALGRVGHATLKRKVRHRAAAVVTAFGSTLPNLLDVLDMAVDARNHFVHGSESKIDYVGHFFATVGFFTLTLEFVFVVSDLLEAGWDVQAWRKKGSTLSHPLKRFIHEYPESLKELRGLLPEGHKLKAA